MKFSLVLIQFHFTAFFSLVILGRLFLLFSKAWHWEGNSMWLQKALDHLRKNGVWSMELRTSAGGPAITKVVVSTFGRLGVFYLIWALWRTQLPHLLPASGPRIGTVLGTESLGPYFQMSLVHRKSSLYNCLAGVWWSGCVWWSTDGILVSAKRPGGP